MDSLLHAALELISVHPHIISIFVFFAAFTESVAVLGTFVPGSTLIIGAGALVPLSGVGLWPVIVSAIAGAIAGDGLSYWLGHRYHQQIRAWRFFRRHPQPLDKASEFCARYGAKSVFFGRFVQALRAFVPLVAGMVDMPRRRFFVANALSAAIWAPLHLLPGLALGASLSLAAAVTSRLLVLVVLLFIAIAMTMWLSRLVVRAAARYLPLLRMRALAWAKAEDSFVRRKVRVLLDPDENEARVLMALGVVLVGAGWLFAVIIEQLLESSELISLDSSVYNLLQSMRTPWGDRVMVAVTMFGDPIVIATVALAVLIFLLAHRLWRRAAYWAFALSTAAIFLWGLKALFGLPRPPAAADLLGSAAFPSGHSAMSAVLFGSIAMLVMAELRMHAKVVVAALSTIVVMAIATSRIYLGVHWLSDVIGGLSFGLVWVAALSIAFVRHRKERVRPAGLLAVACGTFLLVGGAHIADDFSSDLARFQVQPAPRIMTARAWWNGGFVSLPERRVDLEGMVREPLTIQWAGELGPLAQELAASGYRAPAPWSLQGFFSWLSPEASPMSLPVLPRLHDGRLPMLVMIHDSKDDAAARVVVRMWPSDVEVLGHDGVKYPLWVGTSRREEIKRPLSLLTLMRSSRDVIGPRRLVEEALKGESRLESRLESRVLEREGVAPSETWDGKVLLAAQPGILEHGAP